MNASHLKESSRPLLHRINDVVRMANVGRTTIYGEIASGRLRIVKLGRATLVRDEDLHTWLDAMAAGTHHAA
ncbi:helix-turn-helix domain-containing protein [Labrys okinawensis]|uniref:helix-turn-helix domain-containing protein n=1 Tax=Labrys okinawensis TaxID=346911 RepID=UPI0039BCE6F4